MGLFQAMIGIFLIAVLAVSGCIDSFGSKPQPELCNEVSFGAPRDSCFHRAAVATANPALCRKISGVATRDTCLSDLASGQTWVGVD